MARVLAIGNMYPPHALGGGYEAVWQYVNRRLRESGHVVRVLTSDLRLSDVGAEVDPDVHRELRWYWRDHEFPPIGQFARLRVERHNRSVLRRHLRELRPRAVMWWAMGGMSLSLIEQVRRTGLPAVGYVADDWLDYGPAVDAWSRAWSRRPLGRLVGALTRIPTSLDPGAAAEWHFISERTRDWALRMGWRLPRTEVTPAGVDPILFSPRQPGEWDWRILYPGRIDPRKGIATAIEALGSLPERATLSIVGGGDNRHESDLRALADRMGLQGRVEWEPARPRVEMPDVYGAADAVVFPVTWDEPWGLVPLEAMAVGRPVVATGTGGSAEYLRDGRNCLLFDRGQPQSLAAALRRLADDPGLRERLVQGGRECVSRYPEEACSSRLERALVAIGPSSPADAALRSRTER